VSSSNDAIKLRISATVAVVFLAFVLRAAYAVILALASCVLLPSADLPPF
jgi:signal transduction histidine kinase